MKMWLINVDDSCDSPIRLGWQLVFAKHKYDADDQVLSTEDMIYQKYRVWAKQPGGWCVEASEVIPL